MPARGKLLEAIDGGRLPDGPLIDGLWETFELCVATDQFPAEMRAMLRLAFFAGSAAGAALLSRPFESIDMAAIEAVRPATLADLTPAMLEMLRTCQAMLAEWEAELEAYRKRKAN